MKNDLFRRFRIITLAFCLGVVCHSHAAQPRITKSSLSNLLHQPTVSAVYRDSRGILWIGTQQGLHRFDGAQLTVFDSDSSNTNWIPESEIRDIAEDNSGNVLAVTSGGTLLKLNRGTETFDAIKIFGLTEDKGLVSLRVSKQGRIWLLSKDRLFLFDEKFQTTEDWVMQLDLSNRIGRLRDLVEDESGNLWVAGSLGLAEIVSQTKSFRSFDLKTLGLQNDSGLTALSLNSEANLIIGTSAGQLVVWDIPVGRPVANAVIANSSASYISDFEIYGDTLIIATDRGLFTSDDNLSYMLDLSERGGGLSNPDVYSLFRDGNYVWIGTINGLDILSFVPFELFNSKNSGVSNTVQAFDEDITGHIWIGTYSGLYRYDDLTHSHSRFHYLLKSDLASLGDQGIATIAQRGSELWLGFFQSGLRVVNVVSGEYRSPKLSNSKAFGVTNIVADNGGDDVWIATYDHGLFRITGADIHSYFENHRLSEKTVTLLFQSKSTLLVVSENRAYKYYPQTDEFRQIDFDFGLGESRPFIYSLAQTFNDDIIIGTKDHGLFFWSSENQIDNQYLLQSSSESSLKTSTIYGIEIDSKHNFWCSTQDGIVKLDSEGQLIRKFTTADGLQGDDFSLGASFTSRAGLIYFGGVNGYNRFDPEEVVIDREPSPMRLTGITFPKLNGKVLGAVDELESLQLTHKDHLITFQFSVLDFVAPERNEFRYKLENFDPYWIDNGTRNTATYTNLPAGKYVLRVQGANSAGIWNRNGISLEIEVLPPPWHTWWAYSIYCISLLFLAWGAHRIYHSYAVERESRRLASQMFEAANKADDDMQEQMELQDELIRSAYQHQLTTLTVVSDFVSHRGRKQENGVAPNVAERCVKRIAALSILEDCLYYQAGDSVANLHKYAENIFPLLLDDSTVKTETIVTINEITTELVPAELATPLSIVIFELLENCIQHAFTPESAANYIHLKLVLNAVSMTGVRTHDLSVHDSGIGLPDSIENLLFDGSGICLVQSIVQKLGGTLECIGTTGTKLFLSFPNSEDSHFSDDSTNPN